MPTTRTQQQERPHDKPHMPSQLARIVERASYRDIGLLTLVAWLISAVLLTLAPQGHGIIQSSGKTPGFADALYFALVTLTSLGYGDFTPQGGGRLVAGALVLYGLGAVALFVGKLASERSQAMVLLLHTSDRDRRLRGFANDISGATQQLRQAVEISAVPQLMPTLRDLTGILEGVSNYIAFHGHHSSLGSFGNAPALNGLITSLVNLAQPVIDATTLRAIDVDTDRRLKNILSRVNSLVGLIIKMQLQPPPSDLTARLLMRIRSSELTPGISQTQVRHQKALTLAIRDGQRKAASTLTEAVLSRVFEQSPSGPFHGWPRDQNKRIATSLGISRNLANRSVSELRKRGRLPK